MSSLGCPVQCNPCTGHQLHVCCMAVGMAVCMQWVTESDLGQEIWPPTLRLQTQQCTLRLGTASLHRLATRESLRRRQQQALWPQQQPPSSPTSSLCKMHRTSTVLCTCSLDVRRAGQVHSPASLVGNAVVCVRSKATSAVATHVHTHTHTAYAHTLGRLDSEFRGPQQGDCSVSTTHAIGMQECGGQLANAAAVVVGSRLRSSASRRCLR